MSHYMSPEQRMIQQQRERINALVRELGQKTTETNAVRRDLDAVRRRLEAENVRLAAQMQAAAETARKDRAQASAQIRDLDRQVKERERLQAERIAAMQKEHTAQVRQLQTSFENENRNLQQEIRQTRRQMQQDLGQLRVETDRKLEVQRQETARNLAQVSSRLEGQIHEVDRRVETLAQQIAAKEQGDKELAVYWAEEAARMLRQIQETFKPQLQDPRKIGMLERKIRQANDDIRGGQYQSALTVGREAFFDGMDMKEDLAVAEMEWNLQYNALRTREADLLQALDNADHRVYSVDTADGKIEYDNGIDYWTNGQLRVTRDMISKLREAISNADNMTLSQLQEAEEQLRRLQEQLALVENAAHINVAMSVSRYDIASKIGGILGDEYSMVDADGDYFAREDAEEYHAIFQNPNTHDQVAVIITPIPDEAGVVSNHIDVVVGNADNDAITRERITELMGRKLREAGVEGCSFPCSRRYGDDSRSESTRVGDIDAVAAGDEKARAKLPAGVVRAAAPNPVAREVREHAASKQ